MTRVKAPVRKEEEAFLPDFCGIRAVFVLVMLSELLALLVTLIAAPTAAMFWTDLGLTSLFILWVALATAMLLCLGSRRLKTLTPRAAALTVFCVGQTILAAAGWTSRAWFPEALVLPNGATGSVAYGFLRNAAVAGLVTALWLRYRYVQYQWRRQVRAEGVARLDALQARMRPHFLFNGLNTIASLIRHDPAKAEELILDFAEMFRALLRKDARMTCLEEEIALLRQYLNVEGQRLGERLRVVWNLDTAPGDALLPPLSLQPLVENAVHHGIEPLPGGGMIEIHGEVRKGDLVLTVRSPAPAPGSAPQRIGNREAVANLRLRLENCFPGRGQVQSSMVEGRYQARIVVPYRTSLDEDPHRR